MNNLSAKYYQKNNERLHKKACKRYQVLSEGEKEKSPNQVGSDIKAFLNIITKGWLIIEKII